MLLGNAAIGAYEIALGYGSSAFSVAADGVHNIGDVVTYREQIENVSNKDRSEERRNRTRKLSHWVIALTSAGVGAKAGYDLTTGHESTWDAANMYVAGASLALSGGLYARLRQQLKGVKDKSPHVKDLAKHFWGVDIPSAGLALTGALLQRYSVPMEQVMGIANGVLGTYVFRPTKANLGHVCLSHGGGTEHLHDAPDETVTVQDLIPGYQKRSWWQQMRSKGRHRRR